MLLKRLLWQEPRSSAQRDSLVSHGSPALGRGISAGHVSWGGGGEGMWSAWGGGLGLFWECPHQSLSQTSLPAQFGLLFIFLIT